MYLAVNQLLIKITMPVKCSNYGNERRDVLVILLVFLFQVVWGGDEVAI
jgi:hypothetical protein